MNDINVLLIALAVFVFIILVMIFLRVKIGEKFEVKYSDMTLAFIPVVLLLLLTGKIQKFGFGGFEVVSAFKEASKAPVSKQIKQIEELPVEPVRMGAKGGFDEIPQLIVKKTEALSFQSGRGGYVGSAIEQYLRELCIYPFFKYIIISRMDGKFVGMADARGVFSVFSMHGMNGAKYNAEDFVRWINKPDPDIASLSKLDGFVPDKEAVNEDTDKQTALERMEALNIEMLPVIDKEGKFVGVVERSRLTSSLIIDVAKKVK